ncbi:hypothetical protein [Burkholderia cenocepacia]|uniref:Uncharacterized protein n=1 Tax=Burkholderia cenocepacia TaxID=95486 RepID=A0ABD4UPF1_9BURK|nr:hypothetical protein [Burkholderia cenocepacia]MCW3700389.1 hypothetical protein [Burkholderia cenocepacia]MCW3707818.1 hypothetical protein [Burkholderia cenocepacia]MCW3716315.1 hypothetical protein [Burkholderia cenocepacia]MCW3724614.1 hypothetical protein [Burkholderia cenocepacia]MCW3731666.1 hypothetical protein [Burkholderia cenocepacia]
MDGDKQEFLGPVGDVAGRDVVNHNYGQGRLLTKVERADLNKLVRQLEIEFGTPGWQTWKFLHRTIGVENVETMCLVHRDPAETILGLLLELAKLQQAKTGQRPTAIDLASQLENKNAALADLEARFQKQGEAMQGLRAALARAERKASKLPNGALRPTDFEDELKKRLETSQGKNRELTTALNSANLRLAAGRRNLIALAVALTVAVACGAVIWRSADKLAKTVQLYEAKQCMYSGKPYAVGSVIDNAEAPDIECVASVGGGSPLWKQIRSSQRR